MALSSLSTGDFHAHHYPFCFCCFLGACRGRADCLCSAHGPVNADVQLSVLLSAGHLTGADPAGQFRGIRPRQQC